MKEIIKIESKDSNNGVLSAKELHKSLGVTKHFNGWVVQKIKNYSLVENEDYVILEPFKGLTAGRREIDYALTVNSVIKIVMGTTKLESDAKSSIIERFCSIKSQLAYDEGLFRTRERHVKVLAEKDRVIANLSRVLAENNGIPLMEIIGSYKDQEEFKIIKDTIAEYRESHGLTSDGEAWRLLYNKFDATYGMDIRAVAEGSKLNVIDVIFKIGMLRKLAQININSPYSDRLNISGPLVKKLVPNSEFGQFKNIAYYVGKMPFEYPFEYKGAEAQNFGRVRVMHDGITAYSIREEREYRRLMLC